MRASNQCIELLAHFEGFKDKAYKCPAGIWTIGYGNTTYIDGRRVKEGDVITIEEAKELKLASMPRYEAMVLQRVKRPLLQHEFDAAVSFAYNAGTSYKWGNVWRDYDLWKHIQKQDPNIKAYWQRLAITANGKELKGLVRRRRAEVHLYLTGELIL